MCKIVRNCAILLQNTTLNLTLALTHSLAMTLTLTHDPNSNPNPIAIQHLYSAFRILPYPMTVTLALLQCSAMTE